MFRRSIGTFERLSRARSRPPTTIFPRGRVELLQQQADERRLAGAGRADDEHELALVDVERDVPQRDDVGLVDLRDPLEDDHRPGARGALGRRREVGDRGRERRSAHCLERWPGVAVGI